MKNRRTINNGQLRELAMNQMHALSAKNQDTELISDLVDALSDALQKATLFAQNRKASLESVLYGEFFNAVQPAIADAPNKLQMLPPLFDSVKTDLQKPDEALLRFISELKTRLAEYLESAKTHQPPQPSEMVLKPFVGEPLAVWRKDSDDFWDGRSNFLKKEGMVVSNIIDLPECKLWLSIWDVLDKGEWLIFDGRTFTFYFSKHGRYNCEQLAARFIENPDFTKIKFVEGLPDAKEV